MARTDTSSLNGVCTLPYFGMHAETRIKSPVRVWRGKTVMERFMSKVNKLPSGCWLWHGPVNRCGYGKFTVQRVTMAAHRFAYHNLVGPIPPELTIDHLCRNRDCVNPKHLEPVSMRENLLRGDTLQAANARKTHCVNGHEFTKQNTRLESGWRQCRECKRIRKEAKRRADGVKPRNQRCQQELLP
jgi:hypothetical protein